MNIKETEGRGAERENKSFTFTISKILAVNKLYFNRKEFEGIIILLWPSHLILNII